MKKYKDSRLYYYKQRWDRLTICSKNEVSKEMEECLLDPDSFVEKGTLLKNGNSSTVSSLCINGQEVVIKRYNIKDNLHALSRAFRPSRASVSWENAHMLNDCSISTAQPIAFIENRWGAIRHKSYLIIELKEGVCSSDYFNSDKNSVEDKEKAAHSIIDILTKLKLLKISHGDMKLSNIIIFNAVASLIDLDSMRQHKQDRTFAKAHEKDVKRLLSNWAEESKIKKMFLDIYKNEK